jgi:hypothetical protein
VEAEPGFFEGDTVAHCGPTLKGEFARTLNLPQEVRGSRGSRIRGFRAALKQPAQKQRALKSRRACIR